MRRLTVTVDEALFRLAKADVAAGRAESVSAWVASAMREKARARAELVADLEELDRKDPPTEAVIRAVARSLGRPPAWVREHSRLRSRRTG